MALGQWLKGWPNFLLRLLRLILLSTTTYHGRYYLQRRVFAPRNWPHPPRVSGPTDGDRHCFTEDARSELPPLAKAFPGDVEFRSIHPPMP